MMTRFTTNYFFDGFAGAHMRFHLVIFFLALSITQTVVLAEDTYDKETILREAGSYLGSGAEGLASVV